MESSGATLTTTEIPVRMVPDSGATQFKQISRLVRNAAGVSVSAACRSELHLLEGTDSDPQGDDRRNCAHQHACEFPR